MPRGAVNAWRCSKCHGLTIAVHVDEGTTPMYLACRATPGCEFVGSSLFYADDIEGGPVEWEWRKATSTELKRWRRSDRSMFEHCQMGGLVLSRLTDAGRAALTEAGAA